MRVKSPSGKFGAALIGLVLSLMVGVGAGLTLGHQSFAGPAALTVWAMAVVVMARVFRGPSERYEPSRPWWRTTERPGMGLLLAVTFGVSAIASILLFDQEVWVRVYAFAVNFVLAFWYAHSSLKLVSISNGGSAAGSSPL